MLLDTFNNKYKLIDFSDKKESVKFYINQFLMRSIQMFRYSQIPESIPVRDLELLFQVNGFAIFTKISKTESGKGYVDLESGTPYAFFGGLGGVLNEYYNPTKATVANPFLNFSGVLEDGKDCVIVRNDALYQGLMPIYGRYASMLAENDVSIRIADINSRILSILEADNDNARAAANQYLTDIEKGKLGVVGSKAFFEGLKSVPYTQTSHNEITQLIELQQYLKAGVFNDIGLNANYNMKREAINSTEAQMGTDALLPFVDDMMRERREGFKRVKEVLGFDIACEFNSAWEDRHEIADILTEGESEMPREEQPEEEQNAEERETD